MSIELEQITKRYHGLAVVIDLTLEVHSGEFFVLLGPSGSGKSTLLRVLAGLTDADHGRVLLHGRDVTFSRARERGVGFVFQNYALFRHMTVAQNLEFALRVRDVQRRLGITTILVTHDQEESFALADRLGVMHQGPIAVGFSGIAPAVDRARRSVVAAAAAQSNSAAAASLTVEQRLEQRLEAQERRIEELERCLSAGAGGAHSKSRRSNHACCNC